MQLVLHDYWRSSAAYRVRIALALKGLAYERVPVDLLAGDQREEANRAVNPQGFVPSLIVNREDGGGVAMSQSLAIVDWLDAAFPEPPLIPRDPATRARVWASALVIASDIHPLNNLRVLKRLKSQFGAEQDATDDWYRHWVGEGLDALNVMADADDLGGHFLGGAAPDLADVCLVPQLYNARRFAMDVARWPRLAAAEAACAALPAFAEAHPERVKP